MNIDTPTFMEYFLDFSVVVTGFSRFELQGTGQAALYFSTIRGMIGGELFGEFLQVFRDQGLDPVWDSLKWGPIARNILKLWYISTWEELPAVWMEQFGTMVPKATFIADPYAYPEGLLWPTIGVNPPAAKAPGFGTWQYPPVLKIS